ncbi:MAG TPA: HEAT repeat domain-containing protein [Thermoanaerobaculia bacterium]|nr:HEAT repeat domain-containing protein [Thermoanaerobaculia bacterium]
MKKIILMMMMMFATTPLMRASLSTDSPSGTTIDANESHGDAEADLYSEGTDAIDEEEWTKAIDIFRRVVNMKGKRVDGALYWMAYAQAKAGRGAEALQTVAALEHSHPGSKWIQDAKALEIDVRQAAGEKVDPAKVNDEELKLIAIQGLLSSDPGRAVPLLKKLVDGPYSKRVKEKALFVLGQSSSPEAAQIIASIARGSTHPELQTEAIKYLAIAGQQNVPLLGEVYRSTASSEVKKEILRAYMIAGAKAQLAALAKSERDPHLRSDVIRQLGVMGASRELQEMYRAETSAEVKKTIIQSLFVGGSGDALMEIARGEPDVKLRATAVRTLGLTGSQRAAQALISFYQSDGNAEIRRAALEGLFVSGNARALIDLAKQEKDPQWKREIVRKLSVMNSKDALDYLTSLLGD